MRKQNISDAVIKRLPKYYVQLKSLEKNGVGVVSSSTLAELLNITASQVRQDFYNFGGFGQQGYGYDVSKLKREIAQIIGLDREYSLIVIGAGHIGCALAGYKGFSKDGFVIKALFDIEQKQQEVSGVPVYAMDKLNSFVKENNVDIAVIATQAKAAQEVCENLVNAGIKSIWNFAPCDLKVPSDVVVENISMSESLFVLSYRAKNRN